MSILTVAVLCSYSNCKNGVFAAYKRNELQKYKPTDYDVTGRFLKVLFVYLYFVPTCQSQTLEKENLISMTELF